MKGQFVVVFVGCFFKGRYAKQFWRIAELHFDSFFRDTIRKLCILSASKPNDHHQNHHDSDINRCRDSVDGKNLYQLVYPTIYRVFCTSQVVQDFFHQRYLCTFLPAWKKKHLPTDHFDIIPNMWQPHLPWLCWCSSLRMPDSKKQRYEHHQQFTGKWNPRCLLLACNKSISAVCNNSKSTEPITSWVKPTKANPT